MATPTVRIFFSSPGDVKMERETARRIVDRLQSEVGERARLEPYFWEHEVMRATRDYQENIPPVGGFDVVVCILWSRLGSPLDPQRHPRPGGGFFESGTEYEFFVAMQAHREGGSPDVLVFRNRTEPRRPSRPKEEREAFDREIDRLDQFFDRYFKTGEYYTAAVNSYRTLGEFEDKLTQGLRGFLQQRLPAPGARARPGQVLERPYLGLAPFDFDDAAVFFGRTAQVGQVVEAFQAQELEARAAGDDGRRFVLVLGASGSGKSSLARAGVLPMLVQPGVIEGAQLWRRAIMKPGADGDPFIALATALLATTALPELGSDGTTAPELAERLRRQPGGAGLLMRQALNHAGATARAVEEQKLRDRLRAVEGERREDDAGELRGRIANLKPPSVRLALAVDQLEELFTTDQSAAATAAFVECLAAIARSGRVFVLATLRSDFYEHCLVHPQLVELTRGSGSYGLPAPGRFELGQMIRQPAAAAGLVFEEDARSGEKLDDLLRDAALRDSALRDSAALPLLSYMLEQLHEQRSSDGVLGLAAYHALGGLGGAIGRRAEAVFTALPAAAQAAFDHVWRQLATLGEGGTAVRRRAGYRSLTAVPGGAALVDALVAARLCTSDQSQGGERSIGVAHEALLNHWPRVAAWMEENGAFLRARARLGTRLHEWLERGRDDHWLVPPGPALGEAESILARHGDALDAAEADYVRRSTVHARAREAARLRRNRLITIGAVVLSVCAVIGSVFAWQQRQQAVAQKNVALASQVRTAFLLGTEMLDGGKTREGLASLAQALVLDPQHRGARDRLYSHHLYGLPKAMGVRSIKGPEGALQRISTGAKDGIQRCAWLDASGTPEVFDLQSQKVVPGPWSVERGLRFVLLSSDGTGLVCAHYDRRCRVWSVAEGKASAWFQLDEAATIVNCSADARLVVEGGSQGLVRIWDVASGEVLGEWRQQGSIEGIDIDAARDRLVVAGGEVVFFDLAARRERRIAEAGWRALHVRFAEAKDLVVVLERARDDRADKPMRMRFLHAASGEALPGTRVLPLDEVADFAINRDGSILAVASVAGAVEIRHRDEARLDKHYTLLPAPIVMRFSPDDRHLLVACPDGTVRIVDAETGVAAFATIHHDARPTNACYSWDGRFLLTSTSNRAWVWDLAVGRALTLPLLQQGLPFAARFDQGGRLWTCCSESGLQAWDARSLEPSGPPLLAGRWIQGALLDEGGTRAIAVLPDRSLVTADLRRGTVVREPWHPPAGHLDVQLSDDGSRAAVTADATVTWIDTATCRPVGTPWQLPFELPVLRIGRDGARAVAMAKDGVKILLRDVATGRDTELAAAEADVRQLVIGPDQRWLCAIAASNLGQQVLLWDLDAPAARPRRLVHDDRVVDLRFSPDGRHLATATKARTAQVFDVSSARPACNPIRVTGDVARAVVFSPDGRLLAVHCGDRALRVYEWREACPVTEVFRTPETLAEVAFSPDGSRLLAMCGEGGPKRWVGRFRVFETAPSQSFDLVALTEATTALQVAANALPVPCDPYAGWERLRREPWFQEPPLLRPISPAFTASSLRWLVDDAVSSQEMGESMPAVSTVRAAIAYWGQGRLNRLRTQYEAASQGPDAAKLAADLEQLKEWLVTLRQSAERGAGDASTCLWLSRQALAAGDQQGSRHYVDEVLRLGADHAKVLRQAATVFSGTGDDEAERRVLTRLCQLEPGEPMHRAQLGFNHWRRGDRASARTEFAAAVDTSTFTAAAGAVARAQMLSCLDRHAEALATWRQHVEGERDRGCSNADSIAGHAIAHQLAGDMKAAVAIFRDLIRLVPSAADPSRIPAVTPIPDLQAAVAKVLEATLAAHPELRLR